jgi:O-antigen/teichoic acid export membrane protein
VSAYDSSEFPFGSFRLTANTVVQAAGTILGALIGLATFLVLTRNLGPSTYGEFAAATAYLFVPIVIADVGLTAGVLREISAHPDRTEQVMRAFLPLSAIVSAVTVIVLLGVALVVPFNGDTKTAIAIGSLGAFLTLMSLSLSPVLQARLQMHWVVAASITGRAVTLGLVAAAVAEGFGLNAVMGAWVLGLGLTFLIQAAVVGRQISLRPTVDFGYWRELANSSFLLGIANALGQINFRVDTIILAWFRPAAVVGYYGAAYKIVELVHSTSGAVGISVFPTLARFAAVGDRRLTTFANRALEALLAMAGIATVLMAVFPEQIISWTAGEQFVPGSTALRILAAFIPFGLATHVLWRLLIALRDDRVLFRVSGGALLLAVVLNILLIPPYGMNAAAAITVGAEALVATACATRLRRRHGLVLGGRYVPSIVVASAVATAVALLVPGPNAFAFAATILAYSAVLVVLPGAIRDVIKGFIHASQ